MKRLTTLMLVGLAALSAGGCASCCAPFDNDYPTFGGKWERMDRQRGRVGSAFYDASQQLNAGTVIDEVPMELEPTAEIEIEPGY